jgi:4-amino-4-deoxy-L-arabinose transferase-like glycosyltransferase
MVWAVAIAIRASALWSAGPPVEGDAALRYDPIARNLLAGHGFSRSAQPPYQPDDFDQPLYPLFLAAIYGFTSGSPRAVTLVQAFLELVSLGLMLKIASALGLASSVSRLALALGLLCPFLPLISARLLTEALATCVLCLAVWFLSQAVCRGGRLWWGLAGASVAVCVLTRPDLVIAAIVMAAVAALIVGRSRRGSALPEILIALVAFTLAMAPWLYRNYRAFGAFRPLGGVTAQLGSGYERWLATWMDDPKYQQDFWWRALDRAGSTDFPAGKIAPEVRTAAVAALTLAKTRGRFDGEPESVFTELASNAEQQRPLRTRLLLPLRRAIMAWLRMPAYLPAGPLKWAAYALWGPFLILVAAGVAVLARTSQGTCWMLGGWIAGRTVLPLMSVAAMEPRYQMEALPACFLLASAGMTQLGWWVVSRVRPAAKGRLSERSGIQALFHSR